jgi:hypothetical protein
MAIQLLQKFTGPKKPLSLVPPDNNCVVNHIVVAAPPLTTSLIVTAPCANAPCCYPKPVVGAASTQRVLRFNATHLCSEHSICHGHPWPLSPFNIERRLGRAIVWPHLLQQIRLNFNPTTVVVAIVARIQVRIRDTYPYPRIDT